MADNVIVPFTGAGDATANVATDDIGGVQHQRVKVEWGVDGTAVDVSALNPLPIQIATLPAGTNNIGDVDVASMPATGTENGALPTQFVVIAGDDGTDVHPLQVDPANEGLKVSIVSSVGGGVSYVDGVNYPLNSGNVTPVAGVYTTSGYTVDDGDVAAVRISPNRNLYVAIRDNQNNERGLSIDANGGIAVSDGGGSLTVDGTVAVSGTVVVNGSAVTQPISAVALPLPTGAATAALQTQPGVDIGDVTINNAGGINAVNVQDGGNSLTVDDGGSSLTVDGSVTIGTGLPAGANNIGSVTVGTGLPTGANTIGSVTLSAGLPAGANTIGAVTLAAGLPTGVNSIGTVAVSSIVAGLPTGANTIGAVASIVGGLPTGANTIGTVVVSSVTGGLPTGANTIGAVTLSAGLPTGANTIGAVSGTGTFAVQDSQVIADNAGFTDGTSKVFMGGYVYDEVAGTALTENDAAAARININRAQVAALEDGTTRGRYATVTASNALKVDGSAVTQPVSGTVAVSGLPAGANTIGAVTISAGLPTGANTIGGVNVVAGLPTGANTIGTVVVSSVTAGLPTGANTIGAVASIVAGLPTGANTIGNVTVSSIPGTVTEDGVSAGGETAHLVAGIRNDNAAAQTSANGDYGVISLDSAGRVGIADLGGSITVDGSVAITGLPAGANTIGGVNVIAGLPTGANTIGTVVVSSVTAGLPTGANTIGGVNVVAGLPTGANTIGSVGVTAITGGLPTGANTIGAVTGTGTFAVQDSQVIADNAGFTDGTSKVFAAGFIYDEVAGTALTENDVAAARVNVNRAQVAAIEDGATRGRYATVTAANNLRVDLNTGLPTGANTIGAVASIVAGLPTGANTIGAVAGTGTFAVQDSQVIADNAGFTDGTSKLFMSGYIYDDVAGTALTENDAAAPRISANRATVGVIEDGTTRARYATVTAANALKVDGSAVTQPVSVSAGLPTGANTIGAVIAAGDVAHDGVDSGNPVKIGAKAVAHGANPTAVAAADRTDLLASRAGILFTIGGHPNIITTRANITAAQTNVALVTTAAGSKIVVTRVSVIVSNATSVDVSAVIGFGTATTPTTTGVVLAHPGIAHGSGIIEGNGSGILGIGADDEDLRITSSVPTSGSIDVVVSYYTVAS